jgi:hypothetical protein
VVNHPAIGTFINRLARPTARASQAPAEHDQGIAAHGHADRLGSTSRMEMKNRNDLPLKPKIGQQMQFLSHAEVWKTITELTTRCVTRAAAVAYVTSDVVVKFGQGDLLVTDASDAAVLAGQTSGRLIERAFLRGARIVSFDRLHAKVFLFDTTLLIGSANISVRSRSELLEAAVVTECQEPVTQATEFINRIAAEGTLIDRDRIDMLIKLEANRPQSSAVRRRLGEPHVIFFKEILPGDLKKYQRASAATGTGGGARDLRVSPQNLFEPLLQQMISEPSSAAGVTHGRILSRRRGGGPPAG